MAAVTPNINQARAMRVAVNRIEGFAKQFGEAHRNLACHAAFPLVLTPDLLYQIWANFVPEAPWIAVAHVLLSRLCRQVGYETYEMDIADRNLLLRELKEQFGQEQLDKLGEFLLDYVGQKLTGDDPDTEDLAQAQEWTALAYMQPTEAVRELAEALSSRVKHQDMAEVFRLASLVETLAEPLAEAGFEPLLIYSRGMESFARGNLIQAVAQFREVLEEGNQIRVAEVSLPIPEQIFEEAEHTSKQALSSSRRLNTLKLDLGRFYRACSPSSLDWVNDDQKYYIDFSSVRGSNIVQKLRRTITHLSPDEPTCQLFTGNIGCGKSTELRRLEADLKQQDFHVVYFESSQDLDMADVEITDILLAITRAVSESLEASGIRLRSEYFFKLFDEIADILQTPIEFSEAKISLPGCIAEITAKTKDSPKLRNQLRQYLEPRTNNILQLINQEVLGRATQELKAKGKQGLVVLVDNLERIDTRPKITGRTQQEYLFVDRGEQLSRLNCHVVYTIPLALIFSNEAEALKNRLGGGRSLNILPMVPVQVRQGSECSEGMALLNQMVLARAFPNVDMVQRLGLITEVFDSPDTLDRLCRVSGGNLRTLLRLLSECLLKEDPPLSHECIESVIRQRRNELASVIADDEWDLLRQVAQQKSIRAEERYLSLVGSLFIFEYRDFDGIWFDINPILAEVRELYL